MTAICLHQSLVQCDDRGAVSAALGLAHHENAIEQLETGVLAKQATIDEPIVFDPAPTVGSQRRIIHGSVSYGH